MSILLFWDGFVVAYGAFAKHVHPPLPGEYIELHHHMMDLESGNLLLMIGSLRGSLLFIRPLQVNSLFLISLTSKCMHAGGRAVHYPLFIISICTKFV